MHPPFYLSPTTVAKALHDWVDLLLKHLRQLGAVLVDSWRLAIVQPGVVKHEPDVIHVLPRLLVLARVELPFYSRQVHRILHNVKIVLWFAKSDNVKYQSSVESYISINESMNLRLYLISHNWSLPMMILYTTDGKYKHYHSKVWGESFKRN